MFDVNTIAGLNAQEDPAGYQHVGRTPVQLDGALPPHAKFDVPGTDGMTFPQSSVDLSVG